MKRPSLFAIVLCLVTAALVPTAGADPRPAEGGSPLPSRRDVLRARVARAAEPAGVIVRFKDSAGRGEVAAAVAGVDGEVVSDLAELGRVKVIDVAPGAVRAAVEELQNDPAVAVVEPDAPRVPAAVPNDPLFSQQWGLHNTGQEHPIADPYNGSPRQHAGKADADVDAPRAWNVETGSSTETVIAVLDQGFDLTHPDLTGQRWINTAELDGTPNQDDDGNGKVDDTSGWDFKDDDDSPQDPGGTLDEGHGTHVAAIAAAATDDLNGVAGMCPDCTFLPLRFGLTLGQELQAIDYLIKTIRAPALESPRDMRVILNVSFVGFEWSRLERNAFQRLGKEGVLTVAAAGNGSLDNDMFDAIDFNGDGILDDFSPLYPASYDLPHIMSVAATNDLDRLGYATGCDAQPRVPRSSCMFTNWGRTSVDVGAPGVDIKSAFLSSSSQPRYRTWNGTSMAAPLVAGIAGLVAAHNPTYGPIHIKNAIMNSVDRPKSLRRVWRRPDGADKGSFLRTNGRVNAYEALTATPIRSTTPGDGSIAGARRVRSLRKGSVAWPGDVNDVYFKWLKKGKRYSVQLTANDLRRNVDLVVYKPGTKDVWQLEDGCLGGSGVCHSIKPFAGFSADGREQIRFRAPRSGKFFFLVSSYFADARYRLGVGRVKR